MHKTIAMLLNFLVALALTTSGDAPARAQSSSPEITDAEAQAIAVDAYVYFYSLILARIMHHVEHFARLSGGSRAGNPSGWIGVRLLAVQRVWD